MIADVVSLFIWCERAGRPDHAEAAWKLGERLIEQNHELAGRIARRAVST